MVNWAYNINAQGEVYYKEIEFPINTNLKVANWLKLFNLNTEPLDVNIEVQTAEGAPLAMKHNSFQLQGTLDIPLHEEVVPNLLVS